MIVITGQTATGKTELAITLANEHKGELINADSRQIYKGLDIVTGKDLHKLKSAHIPYHLFDIINPNEQFSSFQYVQVVAPIIQDVLRRGHTPIIVGGTYLYIKHLLYGPDSSVKPNQALRHELEQKTLTELQARYTDLFSGAPANTVTPVNESDWKNPRRLIRRIELLMGDRSSEIKDATHPTYKIEKFIGLAHVTKESLGQAIHARITSRMQEGALAEVTRLINDGYTERDPGLSSIGYKQLIEYKNGVMTRDQALSAWHTKEVQYAKRQLTFLKTDSNIAWIQKNIDTG